MLRRIRLSTICIFTVIACIAWRTLQVSASCCCANEATDAFEDAVDPGVNLTKVYCNHDVAIYYDDDMRALNRSQTRWVGPFMTEVYRFLKTSYGSCSVARDIPPPMGPGCEQFGLPKPLFVYCHENKLLGGMASFRHNADTTYKNIIDVGAKNWYFDDDALQDVLVHETCHMAEAAGQGVNGSPMISVWGDSKWAELCVFDFYNRTGRTAEASRVYTTFSANTDNNLPVNGANVAWFKDFFYPLWVEKSNSAMFMEDFFGLLSQYYPTVADTINIKYAHDLNIGEFIHFMSGAVGRDLSGNAPTVFNSGWNATQFTNAKAAFPAVTY
ncbi:hypothetical protein DFS34DRAFT_593534 [Phlyctochytrium arcticum]|nr:hypothetical protein DFS34DRAFT_593534 [Phlyctochytrium arcticum]